MAGAQGLAQGLGAGFASAGDSLANAIEHHKKLGSQAKAFETLLSTLSEDERPISLDEFKNLSAQDKVSTGAGFLQAQGYQHAQEEMKNAQQRRLTLADSLQGAQEQRANTARFPEFARSLTEATAPTTGQMQDFYEGPPGVMPEESLRPQARAITPRDFFQSLQSSGYNPGNETDSLLRSIEAGNERGGVLQPGSFTEDAVSGQRFYERGRTVLPSGVNPARMAQTTALDEQGPGTYLLPNGRTVTIHPPKADIGQVRDRDKYNAISRQITAISPFANSDPKMAARLKELEAELKGLGHGGGTGAAAPAAQSYQKGQRAIQNGVTYEFDGQNWNPAAR